MQAGNTDILSLTIRIKEALQTSHSWKPTTVENKKYQGDT